MKYHCTPDTDLDELIGHECADPAGRSFAFGPIPQAMLNDEELVLENSCELPVLMAAKLQAMAGSLLLIETAVPIRPGEHFRVILA